MDRFLPAVLAPWLLPEAVVARCSWNLVSSLSAITLAALGAVTTSGCQGFNDLQDLELARAEARYVPTELGATLGLALMDAREYGAQSAEAQAAWINGETPTADGCASVGIVDGMAIDDLSGAVRFDFPQCEGRSGSVIVQQDLDFEMPTYEGEYPEGEYPEGEWPPEGEGEFPPGTEADFADALDPTAIEDGSVAITYAGYSNGMLRTSGAMSMTETGDVGTLDANLRIGALDYEGDLDVSGEWTEMADGLATRLSLAGDFTSVTGVEWTVVANNVVFQPGCMDGLGGDVTLIHDNPHGRVTVQAVFDATCDGCATLYVDGEEQATQCFGDGTTIGGF